jgi:hypothetical protein
MGFFENFAIACKTGKFFEMPFTVYQTGLPKNIPKNASVTA